MKTLILVRHAKSEHEGSFARDFDRPLNTRGLRDAPAMGARLVKADIKVDLIVSSTAVRAKETSELIAESLNYKKNNILWQPELYHAPPGIINDVVLSIPNNPDTIMIVCHNPGITLFANHLAGVLTENMPTCALAAFTMHCSDWTDFESAKKELLMYDYPKRIVS
jgi:phosphohistidine phosphatase